MVHSEGFDSFSLFPPSFYIITFVSYHKLLRKKALRCWKRYGWSFRSFGCPDYEWLSSKLYLVCTIWSCWKIIVWFSLQTNVEYVITSSLQFFLLIFRFVSFNYVFQLMQSLLPLITFKSLYFYHLNIRSSLI